MTVWWLQLFCQSDSRGATGKELLHYAEESPPESPSSWLYITSLTSLVYAGIQSWMSSLCQPPARSSLWGSGGFRWHCDGPRIGTLPLNSGSTHIRARVWTLKVWKLEPSSSRVAIHQETCQEVCSSLLDQCQEEWPLSLQGVFPLLTAGTVTLVTKLGAGTYLC